MGRRRDRRRVGIDRSRWTRRYADSGVDAAARREGRRRIVGYARPPGREIDAGDRKRSRSEEKNARQFGKAGVEEGQERSRWRRTALARGVTSQATICRRTARTGAASSAMSLRGNAISSYMVGVTRRRSRFSRIAALLANSML